MNKYTIFHEEPRVSFGSFTFAWEQREFGELYARSSEKNDGTISIDKNITVATMQFKPDIKVTTKEYLKTYFTFNVGDIAFEGHQSKEFKFGRFVENDIGNGIVSHIFAVFRPITEYDLQFWKYAINNESLMQNILSRSTKASTMMHDLVTNDFLKEKFSVPSLEEQRKIGSFLNKLDNLITLHQRESEFLCSVNHTKINKNNAYFTNDWEQRELSNIVDRLTRKNENLESELPLTISAQYGLIDQNEFFEKRIASKDVSGYYLLKKGEFAYNKSTSSDAPWGAVKRLDKYEMGVLSTLYIVFALKMDGNIDSDFLVTYYDTDRWHKEVQAIAAEGARNHGLLNISPNDYFKTNLTISKSVAEQQQIGTFFRKLDHLITLHQRESEKLQNIKKSMLEKMFV